MKKLLCSALALALLLTLAACGSPAVTNEEPDEASYEEQYELGIKYLEEGNYEEAILAFTATIVIDPKRTEAYSGLADTYIKMGDFDKAMEALQQGVDATSDEKLAAWLEKLQKGNVSDSSGKAYKMSHYDADGALSYYSIFGYDADDNQTEIATFTAAGNQRDRIIFTYDANGKQTGDTRYDADDNIRDSEVYSFDANRKQTGITFYNADGNIRGSVIFHYDAKGNQIGDTHFNSKEETIGRASYRYDANDNQIEAIRYDSQDNMTSRETYEYDADGNWTKESIIMQRAL